MDGSAQERLALAIAYLQRGRIAEAERIATALVSEPGIEAPALRVLGLIAEQQGDFPLAVDFLERSLAGLQDLDHLGVLCDLARVLTSCGALASAGFYHYNSGVAFFNRLMVPEACFHFGRAAEIALDSKDIVADLEITLASWRTATALQADRAKEALVQAQVTQAVAALEFANTTDSEWLAAEQAWRELPDSAARSAVYARLRLRLFERYNVTKHNLDIFDTMVRIFIDHFIEQEHTVEIAMAAYATMHCAYPDPKLHFDLIGHWWRLRQQTLPPQAAPLPPRVRTDKSLRVGIADYSSVFHIPHYFATAFAGSIRELQKANVTVFVYTNDVGSPGTLIEEACPRVRYFSVWDADTAAAIAADDLDILLVPNGFMPSVPVEVLIRRPCRRQIVWHHTHTTFGPDLFDATIYDPTVFTPSHRDVSYETPVLLDRLPFLFSAPLGAPPVQTAPRHRTGYITFGVFNRPTKLHLELMRAWARILDRVPNSRLLFCSGLLSNPTLHQRIETLVAKVGIPSDRVEIIPGRPSHREYLACYDKVDISLDSSPFNGGMISFESLWQGVPVVSRYGEDQLSRSCFFSIVSAGLADLANPDFDSYVETAVRLANDGDRLDQLRAGLREILLSSKMMNPSGYAHSMINAFETILAMPSRFEGTNTGSPPRP